MKKSFVKYAFVAAMPLLFAQCQNKPLDDAMNGVDEVRTVDLTIEAPQADEETKTMLQDNSVLLWEDGDEIIINGSWYRVEVNEDNPAYATVRDVRMDEGYAAAYPWGNVDYWDSNMYCEFPTSQSYREGGFAQYANPMMARGNGTNLSFKNMGSILRLGLKGNNEEITKLIVKANAEEEYITGTFHIDAAAFDAGLYEEAYLEGWYPFVIVEFPEPVILTAEPAYIYVVVPPVTLSQGFTVVAGSEDGGVFEVSTTNSVTFERAKIKQMEDVGCAFEPIQIAAIDSQPKEITLKISKKEEYVAYLGVYEKDSYDAYIAERSDLKPIDILLGHNIHWIEGAEYESRITDAIHLGDEPYWATLSADKEYIMLAAYMDYETGDILSGATSYVAKTSEPTGEPPVIACSQVETENPWRTATFGLITSQNVYSDNVAAYIKSDYENLIASGKTDKELAQNYHNRWAAWELTDLYAGTDYIFIVYAESEGGMETVVKYEFSTPTYEECVFGADTEWTVVSNVASLECGFLPHYNGELAVLNGLKVEVNSAGTHYRIENLLSTQKNPILANYYGFADSGETSYTYIELNDGMPRIQILGNEMSSTISGNTLYLGGWETMNDMNGSDSYYDEANAVMEFYQMDLIYLLSGERVFSRYDLTRLYINGKDLSSLGHEGYTTPDGPHEW